MFEKVASRSESGGVQPCQRETRAIHCETTQGGQTPPGTANAVALPLLVSLSWAKTKSSNWTVDVLSAVQIYFAAVFM